tara:strand:- start:11335 stop:11472 length:138 start_codon:yes stop_codon:yes gene_type:complete
MMNSAIEGVQPKPAHRRGKAGFRQYPANLATISSNGYRAVAADTD